MLGSRSMSAAALAAGLAGPALALAGPAEGPPRRSGLVETSRVDVVEAWPFLVRPTRPRHAGRCARLRPDDLAVTEAGEPVEVVDVVSAPPLSTHVLLLDTSNSMSADNVWSRKKNRQMKSAARAYVDWMLADRAGGGTGAAEELLVLGFDDNLRMIVPPTVIDSTETAARIKGRISRLDTGYLTELHDSLIRVARYLETSHPRSAVILLSDGADMNSAWSVADTERVLTAVNNVTFFPIFIRGAPYFPHEKLLSRVAEITGGRDYVSTAKVESKFRDIRERLRGQRYVSYRARPFGEGPGDAAGADEGGNVVRRVQIRSRVRECEIPADGYRAIRYLRRPDAPSRAAPPAGRPSREPAAGAPAPPGPGDALEVIDLVRDWGPLLGDAEPEWAVRRIRPRLPGQAGRRNPEDVIHDWLVEGVIPEHGLPGPAAPVLNGKRFLDYREPIALWLFEHAPGLRERAVAQLDSRLRRSYGGFDPETVEAVVGERLARIGPDDYVGDLAAWHGDVDARDLALALERKEAEALRAGAPGEREAADTVQRRWRRLERWLAFPERVRITVPLEPTRDPDRDVFGFFRVVLPRLRLLPERFETEEDFLRYRAAKVPRDPVGWMLVRWLLGLPEHPDAPARPDAAAFGPLAARLRAEWRVRALDHRPERPGPADPDAATAHCGHRVMLALEPAGAPGPPLRLEVPVDGFTELPPPEPGKPDDRCDRNEAPLSIRPRCYSLDGPAAGGLEELLRGAGLGPCRGDAG